MKWLVTGGCGFIGRALISNLLAEGGHQIRVFDNLSTGNASDLAKIAPFTETSDWTHTLSLIIGDIRNATEAKAACEDVEVVVHLAANTGVAQSVEDPINDCHTNVIGVLNMLEACRAAKARRFIFASSGAPLGMQTPPLHEELAPHPASPYGASKLGGEGYCSAYFHCYGVESVALRFGNVYGEGSDLKGLIVAKFIKQALAGEALEIYGDGTQTRDFIHISDLVRAIRACATAPGIGGETFQIANSTETTVLEMTRMLLSQMKAEGMHLPDVYHGALRDGDMMRNFSDTSKARERLGWQAEVSLAEGLQRTVRYFLANKAA